MTKEGDVVLIYYEDEPTLYARIEAIETDVKKNWYQVTLLLLSIPAQVVTWILREEYINGTVFTMGGHAMKLERIDAPAISTDRRSEEQDAMKGDKPKKTGKVIALKKGTAFGKGKKD
jgi:hypothetical protein